VQDFNPNKDTRNIKMEDGILLPRYRLPTEAEWEYAAFGLVGNTVDERIVERRDLSLERPLGALRQPQERRCLLRGFPRQLHARPGRLHGCRRKPERQRATSRHPVFSYWPNDYGLYNMAGNVSEWVMDVYRPLSPEDKDDFRAFRGNVFKTKVLNSDGGRAGQARPGDLRCRGHQVLPRGVPEGDAGPRHRGGRQTHRRPDHQDRPGRSSSRTRARAIRRTSACRTWWI
jgi:sulfatase modifying factor 1